MTFRNPIIFARELKAEMEAEGLTQTELAESMGVTRARISQWLSLLQLPADLIADVESLGDHWTRRIVTERQLRTIRLRNDPLCESPASLDTPNKCADCAFEATSRRDERIYMFLPP